MLTSSISAPGPTLQKMSTIQAAILHLGRCPHLHQFREATAPQNRGREHGIMLT